MGQLQLNDMKGLGTATIEKLNKGGIKTVEQLALVDTRKAKVSGVDHERLIKLRRDAQKAIFVTAASRFKAIASTARKEAVNTAHTLERLARQATENAVAAAKEAEHHASAALKHAESAAADLADFAAQQAKRAQEAAQVQLKSLSDKVADAGEKTRPLVEKYVGLIQRAEAAAAVAATRAQEAAMKAKEAGVVAAQATQDKSRSLYKRIVGRLGSKKN